MTTAIHGEHMNELMNTFSRAQIDRHTDTLWEDKMYNSCFEEDQTQKSKADQCKKSGSRDVNLIVSEERREEDGVKK